MKVITGELKTSFKNILNPREYATTKDLKEKEYMEQVEIRRQKTNLRRSMIVAFFFIVVLLVSAAVFVFNGGLDTQTIVFMVWTAVMCSVYIEIAEKQFVKSDDDFLDIGMRHRISLFYMSFWIFYCMLISVSPKSYQTDVQGIIMWMVMIFIVLSAPIFSRQELVIVLPVAIGTSVLHVWHLGVDLVGIIACGLIVTLLLAIAQINQNERVESYYQTARNRTEFYETKRRLGKIFEEVFDLAFEFDVTENTCDILRYNGSYDAFAGTEMTIDRFIDDINLLVHPDDAPLCEKNFNMDFLNNEFLLGRTQVYFEVRLKNNEEDYKWVSILITKENEYATGNYLLCLIQDIEERKRNENKLRLEAEKDPLTQLYNKVTTKSLIEECLENNSSSQHALMVIDIDNFKTINDTRGHTIGDQILLAFTAELNKNFRETDIVGRAGGDEFVVLMKNVQSVAMICDKLQRLTSAFKKYGIDNGFPGRLSTSIGVALYNKDGKNYEELFKKADAALYEAKRNGKDQYKFSISSTEFDI